MGTTQQAALLAEKISQALGLHRAGRLRDAEQIYRAMLAADPENADALHYLGVIAHQSGRPDAAVNLIERACAARPGAPDMLNNLGEAYRAANRPGDAENAFLRALSQSPHYAEALNNLGNVLQERGRLHEAQACYRRAIASKADFAEAHNNLGALLKTLRQSAEAEQHFRLAIAHQPAYLQAYRNLALLLKEQGRMEEAQRIAAQASALKERSARAPAAPGSESRREQAAALRRMERQWRDALRADPRSATAHHALAQVLARLGDLADAQREYRAALAVQPSLAEAHVGLANTLRLSGASQEAERHYRAALQARPDSPEACNNLANLLADRGSLAEAERYYRQTLQLRPDLVEAHHNLASLLAQARRLPEADLHYRRAVELAPLDARLSWNYSLLRLLLGDFREGFRRYESRFRAADEKALGAARRVMRRLEGTARWQGEPLAGKTMLVWTEQGLGDSIMFARFFAALKRRGLARLLVYCEPALIRLMRSMREVDEVATRQAPVPLGSFDLHCPIMSLAHVLGTTLESLPRETPYLAVPEAVRRAWRAKLADLPRPRVGIAWASGRLSTVGAMRDVPLESFAPLFALREISFVSLQKGEEARRALSQGAYPVGDPMKDVRDLMDTAALMLELDLVVSVDTVVPHLAGALGRPVWLLNRYESDWRWLLARTDSPWYPSMTLFTQPGKGNWTAAIESVRTHLEQWAARGRRKQ